jgi:hypothetical protein
MVVPPAAGAFAGEIVPIPSGTFASWITVRPELVMAKMRWPGSSMVTNWARRLLVSAERAAIGSGRKMRRRSFPERASKTMPPRRFGSGVGFADSAGAGPLRIGW